MVDGTSHQLNNGLTTICQAIDGGTVRTVTDIRTRIIICGRRIIMVTITITTSEHIINNLSTLDEHICTRCSSAIATTIDLFNTC